MHKWHMFSFNEQGGGMKSKLFLSLLVALLGFSMPIVVGCQGEEPATEEAADTMEEAAEETEGAAEEAGEEVGDAVDEAGEAVEETEDAMEGN